MTVLFGGLAWFIYALAWGLADAPLEKPEGNGEQLPPRRKMRFSALILQAFATLSALWLFSLTSTVDRVGAKILVTFLVLAASIQIQSVTVEWGTILQLPESKRPMVRTLSFIWPLLGLFSAIIFIVLND